MHYEQSMFLAAVKEKFPSIFNNSKVLDVGSLNINGSARQFFDDCQYTGIDVGKGEGVDIICEGQKYDAPDNTFDVVISCECFEHNPFWAETFKNMYRMCKPGGFVIMTCATTGRPEHGTISSNPESAPLLSNVGWETYYKNLTESDFRNAFGIECMFFNFQFLVNSSSKDLYFWGIKRKEPLKSIHEFKTNTDKFDLGYIDIIYDRLFSWRREQIQSVLEIGIYRGESILLWNNYFKNAKIIGVDITEVNGIEVGDRSLLIGNINAYTELSLNLLKKINPNGFDLIIDDGPNTLETMQFFANHYPNLLSDNGILVIEDIIDSSWTPKLYETLSKRNGYIKLIDMKNKDKKIKLREDFVLSPTEHWNGDHLEVLLFSKKKLSI